MSHPLWSKNYESLKRVDSALAQRLEQTSLTPNLYLPSRAADGSPLLAVRLADGRLFPLQDARQPVEEAERWVSGLGKECLRCGHVLLFGFGAGYTAMSLLRLSDHETLIWIDEPSLVLLKAVFHLQDLSSLIASPRIRLLGGLTEKEVTARLFSGVESNRTRAQGIRLAVPPISAALYGERLQRLSREIQLAIDLDRLKFNTEEIQGNEMLDHVVQNLPLVLEGGPVLRLMGLAAGFPAWIIAPGPSLELALESLARHREEALVIAVDTANRILHRQVLCADLLVSVDFTELNARHFETITADEACLVGFVGIHPHIPPKYRGRTFFYEHAANRLVRSLPSLGPLGELESPGSTAHAAYSLARLMGCSPIILVGNDLSFPGNQWYASGAMQNELHQPERETEALFEVPANDGGLVRTNALYKIYIEAFSQLVRDTAGWVINASRQGAQIEGVPFMPFDETIERYCNSTLDKSMIPRALHPTLASRRATVLAEMHELADACLHVKEKWDVLRQDAARLSLIPRKFHTGMTDMMKRLGLLLSSHASIFSLTIPLCTRSTVALFGQMGDVGLLGGDTAEANEVAKTKFLQFLDEFSHAMEHTASALQKGVQSVTSDK